MEKALRALLLNDSGVSSLAGTRINFGAHPQGDVYPAIVLNTISDVEGYHMNGSGGLFRGRVQVDCYGTTYGAAKRLSRSVRSLLHFHRSGGFLLITQLSSRDSREGGSNEAERPYRVSMDFQTAWRPE